MILKLLIKTNEPSNLIVRPSTTTVDRNHPLAIKIRKQIVEALNDFNMIQDNDKIMICVSGGKDSSILTILMDEIRKKSVFNFSII